MGPVNFNFNLPNHHQCILKAWWSLASNITSSTKRPKCVNNRFWSGPLLTYLQQSRAMLAYNLICWYCIELLSLLLQCWIVSVHVHYILMWKKLFHSTPSHYTVHMLFIFVDYPSVNKKKRLFSCNYFLALRFVWSNGIHCSFVI